MTNKKESFKILSDNNLDSVKEDQLEYKSFAKALQYIVTNTETPIGCRCLRIVGYRKNQFDENDKKPSRV